jgi:hypothetical protein
MKQLMEFKPGDFSFIEAEVYKKIYEYDYKVVEKLGEIVWNKLKTFDFENPPRDFVIEHMNNQLYPGHNAITYKSSLKNLKFISEFGWDQFVKEFKKS